MLIKYKERYSILFRTVALTVVCLFLYNDIAFALAPKLAISQQSFQDEYLLKTFLLSHQSVNKYISQQLNPNDQQKVDIAQLDGYRADKAYVDIDGSKYEQDIGIVAISGLLRNTGQLAHIGLGEKNDKPIIYIDSDYFYNEAILVNEKDKIAKWEGVRRDKGLTRSGMRGWIKAHLYQPDPADNKTSRQIAEDILGSSKNVRKVERIYGEIRRKYKNFVSAGGAQDAKALLDMAKMYGLYQDADYRLNGDDNDINIAAQERITEKAVSSSDKKSAFRKLMFLARSMMPRPMDRSTWIEENVPELAGKTILSISLEGNIPEFSSSSRVQNANTKGGLGAYFGDKFEGFDKIGMNASGIQPGYMFDKSGNYVDYDELVTAGVLKEVRLPQDVGVWTWIAEDSILYNLINGKELIDGKESWKFFGGWCVQQSHGNALLKVKFYQIMRKGVKRYIAVSPVWDKLYTEDRNHRFSQEISFGKAVYEFCKKTNFVPDILHLNEGHAVVAASEMRADPVFDRTAIVVTDHTPVEAGHEKFEGLDLNRMAYILGRGGEEFREKFIRLREGRLIVDFSNAVIELADVRNGVSKEHANVTAKLFEKIVKEKTGSDRSINIAPVLNGSGNVWVNEELLKLQAAGNIPTEDELYQIHERAKVEIAFKEIEKRTGIKLDPAKPTNWMVRRLTEYKSQYPMIRFLVNIMCAEKDEAFTEEELMEIWKRDILTNLESGTHKERSREKELYYYKNLEKHLPEILKNIFDGKKQIHGLGMQVVVGGPEYEGHWVNEFKRWMELPALKGKFVYVPDSDANLLKMQAIGADICINMPRDLEEACGTSDQRTGRNGGVTISEHGAGPVEWVTGYDLKTKDGSGFLFGPFTNSDKSGNVEADWDRFYAQGPGELLRNDEIASGIFYKKDGQDRPDKSEWKHLMFNSYCASNYGAFINIDGRLIKKRAVTAQAMEERYARDVYLPAILEKTDTRLINEMVVRDYCTYDDKGDVKVISLVNAAKELGELSKRGVKYISLVGFMKHAARPYEILDFMELDERAGTWKDWQNFLNEARKWRIQILGDWFANQHVAKSSRLCEGRPELFLYTNVSDGNYRLGYDMSCVRQGRYVPLPELKERIENGKAIVRALERMKKDGAQVPGHGWIDIGAERKSTSKKEIEYWLADENARKSIMGLENTHRPVVVREEDALFLASATDPVATDRGHPRRWSALAQPDLSHPEVISRAIETGRFWLNKGISGFRIDAALSNFPDRFQENWGVKLEENLTVKFMRETRAFSHNCFFLFDGYDIQGELLALADYRNCASYSRKLREYATEALHDESRIGQLKSYLKDELKKMPKEIAEHLVNVAREDDSFDLDFQDTNLMLMLYMFVPGFSIVFNKEVYGNTYAYKISAGQSRKAPRIEEADKEKMLVRWRIFNLPKSYKAMTSGVYDYLDLRAGNAIGLARYDADDIIIGAENLASSGWSTFDLKNIIYGQTKLSGSAATYYIKTSYMLSPDGKQWIQGQPEVKSAQELFDFGLSVNLDKKACEIVKLKRSAPGAVVVKKPASPDMAKAKEAAIVNLITDDKLESLVRNQEFIDLFKSSASKSAGVSNADMAKLLNGAAFENDFAMLKYDDATLLVIYKEKKPYRIIRYAANSYIDYLSGPRLDPKELHFANILDNGFKFEILRDRPEVLAGYLDDIAMYYENPILRPIVDHIWTGEYYNLRDAIDHLKSVVNEFGNSTDDSGKKIMEYALKLFHTLMYHENKGIRVEANRALHDIYTKRPAFFPPTKSYKTVLQGQDQRIEVLSRNGESSARIQWSINGKMQAAIAMPKLMEINKFSAVIPVVAGTIHYAIEVNVGGMWRYKLGGPRENQVSGVIKTQKDMRGKHILEVRTAIIDLPKDKDGKPIWNKDGSLSISNFDQLRKLLPELKKQYDAIWLMDCFEWGPVRWPGKDPSSFAPLDHITIAAALGGEEALEGLKLEADSGEKKIDLVLSLIPHISQSNTTLPAYFPAYRYDGPRLVRRDSSDGLGSWDDSFQPNWRRKEVMDWYVSLVRRLAEKGYSFRADVAHAFDTTFKVDSSAMGLARIFGDIVNNDRRDNGDGCFKTTDLAGTGEPNVILSKLAYEIQANAPNSLIYGENFATNTEDRGWQANDERLIKSGVVPYNSLHEELAHVLRDYKDVSGIIDHMLYRKWIHDQFGGQDVTVYASHDYQRDPQMQEEMYRDRPPLQLYGDGIIPFMATIFLLDYHGPVLWHFARLLGDESDDFNNRHNLSLAEFWKIWVNNIREFNYDGSVHASLDYLKENPDLAKLGDYVLALKKILEEYDVMRSSDAKLARHDSDCMSVFKQKADEAVLGFVNYGYHNKDVFRALPELPQINDNEVYELKELFRYRKGKGLSAGHSTYLSGSELRNLGIHENLFAWETVIYSIKPVKIDSHTQDALSQSMANYKKFGVEDRVDHSLVSSELIDCLEKSDFNGFKNIVTKLIRMARSAENIEIGDVATVLYDLSRFYPKYHDSITDDLTRMALEEEPAADMSIRYDVVRILRGMQIGEVALATLETRDIAGLGGLALYAKDVAMAFVDLGLDTTIFTNIFNYNREGHGIFESIARNAKLIYTGRSIAVPFYGESDDTANRFNRAYIYETMLGGKVRTYALRNDRYGNVLYGGFTAEDLIRRYRIFSLGMLEAMRAVNTHPAVLQTNEGATGFAIPYLTMPEYDYLAKDSHFSGLRVRVHANHNLDHSYQNIVTGDNEGHKKHLMRIAGFNPDLFEHHMLVSADAKSLEINPTYAANNRADYSVTVSPGYRDYTADNSESLGLGNLMRSRRDSGRYVGEHNGIDTVTWQRRILNKNTFFECRDRMERNKLFHEVRDDMKHKAKNELQDMLGLKKDKDACLFTMFHRLCEQKGYEIAIDAVKGLLNDNPDAQVVIRGPAEDSEQGRWFKKQLEDMNNDARYIERFKYSEVTVPNPRLYELMYLAADVFLMPSKFEPAGLSQLEALAAGAVVVARDVDGLSTSITDVTEAAKKGIPANGFKFFDFDSTEFRRAMERALTIYRKRDSNPAGGAMSGWNQLSYNAFTYDSRWIRPAKRYINEIYANKTGVDMERTADFPELLLIFSEAEKNKDEWSKPESEDSLERRLIEYGYNTDRGLDHVLEDAVMELEKIVIDGSEKRDRVKQLAKKYYEQYRGIISDKRELPDIAKERKISNRATFELVARYHARYGYFGTRERLGLSESQYYHVVNGDPKLLSLSYEEAAVLVADHSIGKPFGVLTSERTAKNLILAALDLIEGFREARKNDDIKRMADLYRKYVVAYKAKDEDRFEYDGQKAFFYEVGGFKGLLDHDRSFFKKLASAAECLRLALPGLINLTNPDALDPLEVEKSYWNDAKNAVYHTLQALDKMPGFKEAREKNDIRTMAELYRKYVINYQPEDKDAYKYGGQATFFYEVGGLKGLLCHPRTYFNKVSSPAECIRLAIPGLIDSDNPDALKPWEVEHAASSKAEPDSSGEQIKKPESPDMVKEKEAGGGALLIEPENAFSPAKCEARIALSVIEKMLMGRADKNRAAVIAIDGDIAAGKTEFLDYIKRNLKDVIIISTDSLRSELTGVIFWDFWDDIGSIIEQLKMKIECRAVFIEGFDVLKAEDEGKINFDARINIFANRNTRLLNMSRRYPERSADVIAGLCDASVQKYDFTPKYDIVIDNSLGKRINSLSDEKPESPPEHEALHAPGHVATLFDLLTGKYDGQSVPFNTLRNEITVGKEGNKRIIAESTVRRRLSMLVNAGLVKKEGKGVNSIYTATVIDMRLIKKISAELSKLKTSVTTEEVRAAFRRAIGLAQAQIAKQFNSDEQIALIKGCLKATSKGKFQNGNIVDLRQLSPDVEIVVVGDLHARGDNLDKILGDRRAVMISDQQMPELSILEKIRNKKTVLILLGDAIHWDGYSADGSSVDEIDEVETSKRAVSMDESIDIMNKIMRLKIENPDHVYFLSGNHEDPFEDAGKYGVNQSAFYKAEIMRRFGRKYLTQYKKLMAISPLIFLANGFVGAHAGPVKILSLDEIIKAPKGDKSMRSAIWDRYTDIGSSQDTQTYSGLDVMNFMERMGQPGGIFIVGHTPKLLGPDEFYRELVPNHYLVYSAKNRTGYASFERGKITFVEVTNTESSESPTAGEPIVNVAPIEKPQSPDMSKEKEEAHKKTSSAGFLQVVRDNDVLMKNAIDKNTGITVGEAVRARGGYLDYKSMASAFRFLRALDILVPVESKRLYYRFSDKFLGPDEDYTKTLINAAVDVRYQLGKRGDNRPLYRSGIPATKIKPIRELIKMAILHQVSIEQRPAIADDRTLWHIIEEEVIPLSQRTTIVTQVNKAFRDTDLSERILILEEGKSVKDAIEEIRSKDQNAVIDIALSSEQHIGTVPDDKEIKMLVFKNAKDYIQLEGVVAALRALHSQDALPTLLRLYSIMAGQPFDNPPDGLSDDPKEFARRLIFDLPKAAKVPANEIPKLNEHLVQLLIAA